ncbi:MAG: STAS domain-containing protein [Oscillospiraceae bacterium]|nr:STAS domain-containing protein [Oscillospiraceae bacterium]
MSELTMDRVETNEGIKFNVTGRITTVNENFFGKKLSDALEEGFTHIVLNMREVTIMTSIGIRIILKTYKSCMEAGGKFQIEDPSEVVKNVLGLSALQQMMVG